MRSLVRWKAGGDAYGEPGVANEYRRRYRRTPSIIASSMAGRRIIRSSDLVYISTSSLYGRRPNQYDRVVIPVDRLQQDGCGVLRYEYLGRTKGIGTFQFSADTVEAMQMLITQTKRGQRVNSVFGEGVNPRLRKIRDGLDELGLKSNALLDHGASRLVYGVSLVKNLTDYLLGVDGTPKYILSTKNTALTTQQISQWWFERWCEPRIGRDGVLDDVAKHTPVYPVRHGARVTMPPPLDEEPRLFED
ncbi:MAG TPA: Druantia anti-phage system protein DruA [Tepidisphaeraceae bacterium]|nr:Druantia anti-phage system protein DruA [Tepidisphaeraceae bacterium]